MIDDILHAGITMVTRERFDTISRHTEYVNLLQGDVVECGVWKGGMSIFLARTFPSHDIWVCDSFEGFEPANNSTHKFDTERHLNGHLAVSLEEVQANFSRFGYENQSRIHFLKGFVKDTLPTSGINNISLLRIDVDAYSATRDVLEHLYDKVVPGGLVIFDDSCLSETQHAIRDALHINSLLHPVSDAPISLDESTPCGAYLIK